MSICQSLHGCKLSQLKNTECRSSHYKSALNAMLQAVGSKFLPAEFSQFTES